ncbi:glycosyltransferase [Campylobacter felis]|nr:glycosyltransferase [Campylobacter felis]
MSIYKANETPTFALDDRIKLSFLHFKERKRVRTFFYKLIDKFYESYLLKKRYKNANIMIYNNIPHYALFKNKNTHYLYLSHITRKKYSKKFDHFDFIITINQQQKQFFENKHKHTIYIPNFIPQLPIQSTDISQKVVLYLGRFSKEKGVLRLIDIWKRVQENAEFKDWKLIIVGEGVQKEQIEDKIKALHLSTSIIIKPFTKEVEKEYLNASIYAMTSHKEGLPMVLIESASYGLPSIAFDITSGPSDIIENGKSGFLIKDDDLKDYADKLQVLMRDENLRKTMGENAKELVKKRFSKEIVLKKWQDLFASLK